MPEPSSSTQKVPLPTTRFRQRWRTGESSFDRESDARSGTCCAVIRQGRANELADITSIPVREYSLARSADRETLQVAAGAGRFILKPQTEAYPALPENEHVTTRLAQLVGIDVGRFGLVSLKDGSLDFVVRRCDRLDNGKKLRQEDFCQLAELSPKEKYESSAERCVKLLRRFATEPLIEIQKLYRLLVFVWWSGNGDMHLKNFSLLVDEQGVIRLTPAYDLVCTRLVIPNDPLALSILGKKDNLDRKHWLAFAEYCQLPEKAAARVLDAQASALPESLRLIDRCILPAEQKEQYLQLLEERTAQLASKVLEPRDSA